MENFVLGIITGLVIRDLYAMYQRHKLNEALFKMVCFTITCARGGNDVPNGIQRCAKEAFVDWADRAPHGIVYDNFRDTNDLKRVPHIRLVK